MSTSSLTPPPYARELLVAQLAVQRAAVATKRVLATINATSVQPNNIPAPPALSTETSTATEATASGPPTPTREGGQNIGQYLHPSSSPLSPISDPFADINPFPTSSSTSRKQAPNSGVTNTNTNNPIRRLSLAKPDLSPVTIADLAAQALLIAAVHDAFPNDLILGEEDAAALREDPDLAAGVWGVIQDALDYLDDVAATNPRRGGIGAEEIELARPRDVADMIRLIELGGSTEQEAITATTTATQTITAAAGLAAGRRVWCLDPIDGTSAYMQGGQYAISLALLEHGREVVGVLGCPNWAYEADTEPGAWRVVENEVDRDGMGLVMAAVQGQGAWVRPMWVEKGLKVGRKVDRRHGVSFQTTTTTVTQDLSNLHFVDSQKSPATLSQKVQAFADRVGAEYPGTNLYSSHMRYAAMVLGGREFVQIRWPKPSKGPWSTWDHAGSQLIYVESGAGRVTDLDGKAIDFRAGSTMSRNWGLITADEEVYEEVLRIVNEMRKE
ncbi:uncharacterized protein C8A04DRAFT_13687 [Dichotomopilus funicola]|uniref:3'(2'),5'-bisphosphate nucleotidase n=1 Tax=Dichotomopilus funicola TaxID=1934379 RepID=A0AAN6ZLE1_9PEZI|nr:hypothetical protein C8A04DRAFT_13687 [Dichotomopilus funicola]